MKTKIEYTCVEVIHGYEFGLIVHLEEPGQPIEALVIHHPSCMVRTLDTYENTKLALEGLHQFIINGFSKEGITFVGTGRFIMPIPDCRNLSLTF